MKKIKRLAVLLLCLIFAACLIACGSAPAETTPPTTEPAPTEPPAEQLYADARNLLESAGKITLDVITTTTTAVADQEYVLINKDILTYNDYGTDFCLISLKRSITHEHDPSVAIEDASISYQEVFNDGTVYISSQSDSYQFSAQLNDEETAGRYIPAALLDVSHYGSIVGEASGGSTVITFTAPSAAESWAMPADATLLDATGTAKLNEAGALKEMTYAITYEYGSTTVSKEIVSKPRSEALSVVVPQDADKYAPLQDPDALIRYIDGVVLSWQAETATTTSSETFFSSAAMVIRTESNEMKYHSRNDDTSMLAEYNILLMDYNSGESQSYKQKETYLDGKYVVTVDDGVPTSQTGISSEVFYEYSQDFIFALTLSPDYWLDATVTDLGSLYYVEYTCNEDFGDTVQNNICLTFWDDAGFLNKLASAYVTNGVTAYAAYDKYTGLPTAMGYSYTGTHTIDGTDYLLTSQADQSIQLPAVDAYHGITEEMLPEEEPAQKATPLLYHVTGDQGQEMWLFGTIHVGDERTAYLPQEVYDAFSASDALALEFDSQAFDEQMEEDAELAAQVSAAYVYTDGTTLEDHLSEETLELLKKYLKATGNYSSTYLMMKPAMLESMIGNFYLAQGYQLTSMQGCENRLTELANQQEKEILSVESALFQLQMMSNWSNELQEIMLEDILEYDAQEYWQETYELYELWCAGDEAALREMISTEVKPEEMTAEELAEYEEQKVYIDEYNKTMSHDRNDGMLEVAREYLESGDVIFYAVGLGHLLDNVNGLVDTLREAGYTVELVNYT